MMISGKAYWCKLDKPRPNYNKQKKIIDKETGEPDGWGDEWSVEVGNLDKETKLALKDAGLLSAVKNKMDERDDFITFRLSTVKRDGTENDPVKVVGPDTQPWDWKEDGLIGNGSDVTVKFNTWRNSNGKTSAFIVALKVDDLVPYEAPEGSGDYEDPDDWGAPEKPVKKPAAKKAKKEVEEDEDDIPF